MFEVLIMPYYERSGYKSYLSKIQDGENPPLTAHHALDLPLLFKMCVYGEVWFTFWLVQASLTFKKTSRFY